MAFRPRSVAVKAKKAATSAAAASASSSAAAPSTSTSAPASSSTVNASIAAVKPTASSSNSTTCDVTMADDHEPVASTSRALAAVKLDHKEEQRLETLLSAIESCFCDWGLSAHRSSGLLDLLEASKDSYVHLQHVLKLPPVRALTDNQADVQKALKLRPSPSLTVHESGFQLRRTNTPNFERLKQMQPADWDDMAIYLENIPAVPTSVDSPSSLSTFLSTLLSSQLQRLVLPPLYDPSNPPSEPNHPRASANDQSEVFAKAQAEASGKESVRRGLGLPTGGGPFRGFAFVVLETKEDAERALETWAWEKTDLEREAEAKGDAGEDRMDEDGEEGKPTSADPTTLARRSGFRALSYARWLDLKAEYLDYQHHLTTLRNSHDRERKSHAYQQRSRRSPSPPRPSRADQHREARDREDNYGPSPHHSSSAKKGKRASDFEAREDRPPKKARRSSVSLVGGPRPGRPATPEPLGDDVAPDSEEALAKRGAFPKGCIMWVRNVHEKSTKTSLKTVLSGLLEELEEGSGRGVEFVDYEKGLDVCHVRFSSSHLASLMLDHFTNSTCTHLAPTYISSPQSTATPPEGIEHDPNRRPIAAQLLEGERERLYWQGLPESTRRGARKSAAGPVALVKERKRLDESTEGESDEERRRRLEEAEEQRKREREKANEEEKRPRKKPSKF
ncbi:hypothetical protein BCR35DRAFT_80467 [Leucosporidium creatinivorum]|uniref:XRRM domain-containing protein n=1 Tax=Leucosporidium creatinivorum TaxID=106004 RepID=A0A1Y2FGF3_9BASI|nr:hypothetical protein BCR35DRAFT_80467 [Leucosporidium creatinivorum]